jgi:hypothetical protein
MLHEGRISRVSRIVCEKFNGPPPTSKHEAAHSCGKGHEGCVSGRHLRWDTPKGNQADRLKHGTHNRGERQPRAKLTEHDVRWIRSVIGTRPQREIAQMFGVHPCVISEIKIGRKWAWLE